MFALDHNGIKLEVNSWNKASKCIMEVIQLSRTKVRRFNLLVFDLVNFNTLLFIHATMMHYHASDTVCVAGMMTNVRTIQTILLDQMIQTYCNHFTWSRVSLLVTWQDSLKVRDVFYVNMYYYSGSWWLNPVVKY